VSFSGRLYCTERALWKLNWFLHDFAYDADLLSRDQIDEKALPGLRGVVRTTFTTLNGHTYQNLDGFAPVGEWEVLQQPQAGPLLAMALAANAGIEKQVENEIFRQMGAFADQVVMELEMGLAEGNGQPAQDFLEDRAGVFGRESVRGKEENEPTPEDGGPPRAEPSRDMELREGDNLTCELRAHADEFLVCAITGSIPLRSLQAVGSCGPLIGSHHFKSAGDRAIPSAVYSRRMVTKIF
jgi:hypothetical protein